MITRIEATRYRCLERVDVELGQYRVLVGANGAGKTTFLDIPRLLSDCLQQRDVSSAFTTRMKNRSPRASSLQELVFAGVGNDFVLAVEATLPENVVSTLLPAHAARDRGYPDRWWKHIRYEVRFEIFNERQLVIGNEYLFLFSDTARPSRGEARLYGEVGTRGEWRFVIRREREGKTQFRVETRRTARFSSVHVDSNMLALPRVLFESAEDYPAASWLHDLLVDQCVFYQPDLAALQTASPPGMPQTLMSNGLNLPWLALQLQQDEQRFTAWVDHVRTALPQVTSIQARERGEDHHAYFAVRYNGGYEVTSSGLSEGTLRVLALTLLPYLSQLPRIVITEEPECGIHPRAIESVLQSLSSAYDSQVLVSSHSPVVLAHSQLDQILCARLEPNGAASFVAGSEHPRLQDWRGRVDLGALFAAGVLG